MSSDYSPSEVAAKLGVSSVCVLQWIYRRRLSATRLKNGYWRISKSELERVLRHRSRRPARITIACYAEEGELSKYICSTLEGSGFDALLARNLTDLRLKIRNWKPRALVIGAPTYSLAMEISQCMRKDRMCFGLPLILTVQEDCTDGHFSIDAALHLSTIQNLPRTLYDILPSAG